MMSRDYMNIIDLTHFEQENKALEGKGSLVMDHRNHRFYCSLSTRSNIDVINELLRKWNAISKVEYRAVTFTSVDQNS